MEKFKVSIGFSKPKKWKIFSALIMLIEGTKYSHVFVTWKCTAINRRKVFEAVGTGIRTLSNIEFKKHAEVVELYHFYVDEQTIVKIEQLAHDLNGRPYSFKSILGLGVMRLFNWFNKKFDIKGRQSNPFKDGEKAQICAEAGALMLNVATGIKLPLEDIGVVEINQAAKENGEQAPQEQINRINGKN